MEQETLDRYSTSSRVVVKKLRANVLQVKYGKIILTLDFATKDYPIAYVNEPLLNCTHILWNGLIAYNGVTEFTFSGGDILEPILDLLNEATVEGLKYVENHLNGLSRIGLITRLFDGFTRYSMPYVIAEEAKGDEVYVSRHLYNNLRDELDASEFSFLDEIYLDIQNERGLKMIGYVKIAPDNYRQLQLSPTIVKNLFLSEDEHVSFSLAHVPIGKQINLLILNPLLSELNSTEQLVRNSLTNYTTFTEGSVITVGDTELVEVAVVSVEAWEEQSGKSPDLWDQNDTLATKAITTISEKNSNMKVVFDQNKRTLFTGIDPLLVYNLVQQ